MDFTGIDPATLRDFGLEIVQRVKKNTGIPISLGIAPTKTLAKIASKLCKQYPKLAGCCYMHRPEDIEKYCGGSLSATYGASGDASKRSCWPRTSPRHTTSRSYPRSGCA